MNGTIIRVYWKFNNKNFVNEILTILPHFENYLDLFQSATIKIFMRYFIVLTMNNNTLYEFFIVVLCGRSRKLSKFGNIVEIPFYPELFCDLISLQEKMAWISRKKKNILA